MCEGEAGCPCRQLWVTNMKQEGELFQAKACNAALKQKLEALEGPAPVGKGADGEGVGGGKDLQQGVKREGGVCAGAAQAEGDQGENT